MKKMVIILSVFALISSSCGQKSKFKRTDDFVRSDETVLERIFGDLNNDKQEDCVIITKQTNEELMSVKNRFDEEVDRNRRGILIAFKNGEYYELVTAIPDCFSSENEDGGVYFSPDGLSYRKMRTKIIDKNAGR